ncbi:MAG: MoaD/ThiS family protein [Candidatus Eremiobacteraeota bacterium]|nr:MoaD/ThiS family protein [Candidatus Eremiobacteraeota bacterium]MBC5801894.1 MoaD/ThiS family protein [Candidatus Eremiobacteraeota bacterium]MBC5820825.1 MoaD/ThiS family protein [Candidatus Eremiobacteraeota bacterium]
MTVRIAAFARIGEILRSGTLELSLPGGATAGAAWQSLCASFAQLAPLRASTRLVINGALADDGTPLHDGDELALLPPFGGG